MGFNYAMAVLVITGSINYLPQRNSVNFSYHCETGYNTAQHNTQTIVSKCQKDI